MIKQFKALQELNKFEKKNKGILEISNIDYVKKDGTWFVEFTELNKQSKEVKE